MAQRVVPAAEILSTSDGDSTAPGKLTKLANTVIPDRSTPYSIQPSGDDLTGRHGETPENPADGSAARLRAAESVTIPPGPSAWQEPKALLECLRALGDDSATRGWAGEAARLVNELGPAFLADPRQATSIIERLSEMTAQVGPMALKLPTDELAADLLRAGYALDRRLDVWRHVVRIAPAADAATPLDPEQLSLCLSEIDAITGDSAAGKAWREYLLVDALSEWLDTNPPSQQKLPTALAQRVLGRLNQIPMDASQRQFISSEPITALENQLLRQAAQPVDLVRLLRHLESYEQTELTSDAGRLADDFQNLKLSANEDYHRLAEQVQRHYCNANLRVAVTAELLNRLMPEREPEYAAVHERVLGHPVHGRSRTAADVHVRLIPDPGRVRMALEIDGTVASRTSATSGPATLFSNSQATYLARKPFRIDLQGIHLERSKVWVNNRVQLRNVETKFDGLPLVGGLFKGIARSGHERNRAAATQEAEQKIAYRARKRIDTEAGARLGKASENLKQQVLEPLDALALEPALISAQTTKQRMTMRMRLAGNDQLGGHTPRPRAPADSLASLQVHHSAVNNVLGRLKLEGRTFTLPELTNHIATRFGQAEPWETDPAHDNVKIAFAEKDAVGVRLDDDRVTLTLSIARLRKSRRQQWTDFKVCVDFRPEIDNCSIGLVRDGVPRLPDVGARSRVALIGIFSQTFSKHRPFYLTPDRLVDHPKLADVELTQFRIDDGWVGIAMGRKRAAKQTASR